MYTHVLRKSLALFVFYAIVIIGIFVLQFKNDSIISEKIGNLHITLLESAAEDSSVSLKNKLNVVFNGISFSVSDEKPAAAVVNGREKPISLIAWEKLTPLSCEFLFTDDISVKFILSDDTARAHLQIETELSDDVSSVYIPYGLPAGSTILSQSDSRIQIGNKKNAWELSASEIEQYRIMLTPKSPIASYSYFDRERTFSFETVAGLNSASESVYAGAVDSLKSSLIAAFASISSDSANVTEQEAVSYVAAMAERGRYNEALDAVPQSFRRGSSRTYLSAPYFDSLVRMNDLLQRQMQNFNDMITHAAETNSFDVFSVRGIADYMCMHPGSETVHRLLAAAAGSDSAVLSVQQAAGILGVCAELQEKNRELYEMLLPAASGCVSKIEASCSIDNDNVTVSEKGTFLSVIQAVQVGDAVLQYGLCVQDSILAGSGRMIINSYLKECSSFDLRTLAELYPAVVHDNSYYPHYQILAFEDGQAVWAWTCAGNIGYAKDSQGSITLSLDFPVSYTHYLIVNGIRPFRSIYIYDMAFRTDPRFETYNSSGYVYQASTNTLLLKSRQKSEIETVRLVYTAAGDSSGQIIETDTTDSAELP